MSSYIPPSKNLALFDTTVFSNIDDSLTIRDADKRYLRFPIAQGKETLQAIDVNGLATFNNTLNVTNGIDSIIITPTSNPATTITVTTDDTASTFFPTFVSTTGNRTLSIDNATNPLSYVPSTSTLSCSNFNGTISNATTATNANNISIINDNTNATFYPTFVNGTGYKQTNIDITEKYSSY